MPPFPQWGIAILIAAGSVWMASKWQNEAAWYLAVILLLSVLIKRDVMLNQLSIFMQTVFGTPKG
jgi:hypothetical protein